MSEGTVNGDREPQTSGQQFWNSTITNLSHGAQDLWKSPKGTVIRIEVLVSLVAGVLILLAIFGSRRRRSRNWFLQKGVFAAYTLSFSLATYILGSMQSSGVKSSMYPIWSISLIMLHGSTDSITAYSLDDNKQQATFPHQALMSFASAVLLLFTVPTNYSYALAYTTVIAFGRYALRFMACRQASYSWHTSKVIADYMYDQQNESVSVPATMEDCNYLVDWSGNTTKFDALTYATQLTVDTVKNEIIDIGKVWRCKEMSLGPELKDSCLSFSLFQLLSRRFFGYACDESKARAHNFVFGVLLSENQDGATDYNRVFNVIEVELAFMYDFFFTKCALMYYTSPAITMWSLVSVFGISITAYITVRAPVKITQDNSPIVSTIIDDMVITLVILASSALLEFLQLLVYWMGIWGRVSFVCQSLREREISDTRASRNKLCRRASCHIITLKEILAKIGLHCASNRHYWRHKLGQYSLLDSVQYSWFAYVLHEALRSWASRVGKKAGKSVELPDEVKEALVRSLKRTGGTLSNGKSSLASNGAQHLSWACTWVMHSDTSWSQRKQNQTHIILTWHIATCYCEMLALSPEFKVPFRIATKLSKYCAYLVVCAPRFLPGHHYDTRCKFDAAAAEAAAILQRGTGKYEAIKSLTVPEETKKIFESGVKLGKQLEDMEEGNRWLVLADFWAEMMLYVAPSDNVKEHIEQLARGGEFITHLWALLSHAGILEREPDHPAGGV
uniref:Uncharacterized protein n=2 Tax=Avena sativa TaxID=4498 RepID=A0ACD6AAU8_AVESA